MAVSPYHFIYAQQARPYSILATTALLASAARVFAARGYHETSMRDLATETGTSLSGLYYYVKSKEELLGHVNLQTGRTWKVINEGVKNHVGEPVGDRFLPGDNAFPFASPNAWWRKRASGT